MKLSVSYRPISRPILGLSLMLLVIDEQIQLVAHGLNLFIFFQFFCIFVVAFAIVNNHYCGEIVIVFDIFYWVCKL